MTRESKILIPGRRPSSGEPLNYQAVVYCLTDEEVGQRGVTSTTMRDKRPNPDTSMKQAACWILSLCIAACFLNVTRAPAATFAPTKEERVAAVERGFKGALDLTELPHHTDEQGRTYVEVDDMKFIIGEGVPIDSAFTGNRWTNGVVYYAFDSAVTSANRQNWRDAAAAWGATAALTFTEGTGTGNYIYVQNGSGNNSYVGMIGGQQAMNIFNWTYRYIVAHEIGHALGLIHEHQRSDRDSYVTINYAYVQSGYEGNFQIAASTNYATYDFDSVMHYDKCAFSTDCPPGFTCACTHYTIAVLPPNATQWQDAIGQRDHLSQLDGAGMAQRYGGGGSLTVTGTTAGKPTWNRPDENGNSPPVALSSTATAVPYEAKSFTVSVTGSYTLTSTATSPANWDNYLFLYANVFNAATPLSNVLIGNDDDPSAGVSGFSIILQAGTLYYAVNTGYSNSSAGAYSMFISGPGSATLNQTYTITTSSSPASAGSTSGGGTFAAGTSRTVTATANSGYTFSNWTENGNVVSSSASYTFTLNSNRNLVANFATVTYTITISSSPSNGGTTTGDGTFAAGTSQTVTATANSGFTFSNWTENANVASTSASYTFTLNGNRTLVANFATNQVNPPTVQTVAPVFVSSTSTTIKGTVTNDGGAPVSARYFYYWSDPNSPTAIDDSGITTSGNNFSAQLTGLNPNLTYYYRAYAHNSSTTDLGAGPGWGYGIILSFTAKPQVSSVTYSKTNGFAVIWKAKAGLTYQIQRSADPTFVSYLTIVSGIAGIEPTTQYVDSSPEAKAATRMFYRVALQ